MNLWKRPAATIALVAIASVMSMGAKCDKEGNITVEYTTSISPIVILTPSDFLPETVGNPFEDYEQAMGDPKSINQTDIEDMSSITLTELTLTLESDSAEPNWDWLDYLYVYAGVSGNIVAYIGEIDPDYLNSESSIAIPPGSTSITFGIRSSVNFVDIANSGPVQFRFYAKGTVPANSVKFGGTIKYSITGKPF
jgi:hypothetical protein